MFYSGVHSRIDDGVEPVQLPAVAEHPGRQGGPVQAAVRQEHRAEGVCELPAKALVRPQQRIVQPVAVDDLEPRLLQHPQQGGFARAGGAGDADDRHSSPSPRSTTWKPAAFFSRLATASPSPPLPGHWA